MPSVKLYDHNHNNHEYNIPAAVIPYSWIKNIGNGTTGGWTHTVMEDGTFQYYIDFTKEVLVEGVPDLVDFLEDVDAPELAAFYEGAEMYDRVDLVGNIALYGDTDATTPNLSFYKPSSDYYGSSGTNLINSEYQYRSQYTKYLKSFLTYFRVDSFNGYWGYTIVFSEYIWGAGTRIRFALGKSITSQTYAQLDPDSGDKGFKPTAARTRKDRPGQGGRGTSNKKDPDYAGDSVTQPGAPDESVASGVGSGFLNIYKVDTANLNKVGQCLYGSTMLGLLQSIAINPLDFIVSLMVFPCSPSVGSAENIKLGGWLAAAAGGGALGFDATGTKLSKEFQVFDFGSVSIPENWGNFLDYSQTTIELYLPFIGSVNLDVSECMGGTVNVQYTVDFFTGMCVANVLCSRANYTLPSGKALSHVHAQHSYQGNCAIQLPLSAVNYGTMVGSLINACTQGITNPVSGFMGIAADAIGGGFRPNVTSKGNIVANAGFCSVLYPYIRLTRPITAEPDTYQQVIGYMSYINTTLGECEDLCVCDSIDLRGISGATESEMNRIKQMCMEGVYV